MITYFVKYGNNMSNKNNTVSICFILGWKLYSYGPCPQLHKPLYESTEKICAVFNNELKTFSSALALEVEQILTDKSMF